MLLRRSIVVLFVLALTAPIRAEDPPPGTLVPTEWIGIEPVDRGGRRPFRPSQVFAEYLFAPGTKVPSAGDELTGERDEARKWVALPFKDGGVKLEKRMTWAYGQVEAPVAGVMIAHLRGASTLWVNGDAHVGDVYGLGISGVPVQLRKGANDVFVAGMRAGFSLRFEPVDAPLALIAKDVTRAHVVRGAAAPAPGAVPVVNATTEWARDVWVEAGGGAFEGRRSAAPASIPPLGIAKLPFESVPADVPPPVEAQDVELPLRVGIGAKTIAETTVKVKVREPSDTYLRTFRSWIDGSVQRYGVRPASEETSAETGLILTLHGASVRPMNQVNAYSTKPDFWVVAPTNRRPFGFDWQDWGRLDAYEVLEQALALTGIARTRVYLTGHSMGGHGTWHLASNDPDGFVAAAPSAGWVDFASYGPGRPPSSLSRIWRGADRASDTLSRLDNLVQIPTFVLHGDADDNVPASHARRMVEALRDAGGRVESHVEKDAGHWWNGKAAEGADCVDWPGIMDLFRSSRAPVAPSRIEFSTADPVIDADHHWVHVHQPLVYGEPCRVSAEYDVTTGAIDVTTENVRALSVGAPDGAQPRRYAIDGVEHEPGAWPVWFVRDADGWRVGSAPGTAQKGPERSGPFKRAFDREFVLVLPTGGTDAENAAALARVRYDSQVWWYRGNGLAQVVTDSEFVEGAGTRFRGRNAILYGNADTNTAWRVVFAGDGPIEARRGSLRVGDRLWKGDDMGAVFVRPRLDDELALAGAVADTGVPGARLGYRLLTFVSGVGYPDYAAYGSGILTGGDEGILAAGWFDHEWKLDGRGQRAFGGERTGR
jgi:dienelactone hydrolase